MRMLTLALLTALVGCKDARDKAEEVGKKAGKAIDNLDLDDVKQHLGNARDAIAKGIEAAEDCSWAARVAEDAAKDAVKAPLAELKRLCSFDAPLGRATRAVTRAEKAKAEQPEAPSYTECSDDAWAKVKGELEGSSFASEPRWTALKARWTKVCPGS